MRLRRKRASLWAGVYAGMFDADTDGLDEGDERQSER